MSLTEGLHRGMVIRHEGHLYSVLDFHVARTGKQKPTVHVKLRSLVGGNVGERTLDQLGKLDEIPATVRSMQYLYGSPGERVFMDDETFEQYPLSDDTLGEAVPFLIEGESYRIQFVDGQPFELHLPDLVVLEVVETAPVEHVGGNTSVHKEAVLNSGITIQVPMFIKIGDRIRVKTANREYQGKEH